MLTTMNNTKKMVEKCGNAVSAKRFYRNEWEKMKKIYG